MGDIRKIRKIKISRDPKTNKIDDLGSENELHRIHEESGMVESIYLDEHISNSCGCLGPNGGECGQCGNMSCLRCFTHCGGTENPSPLGCGVPLCRECSKYPQMPDGTSFALCSSCYGKVSRKKIWGNVTKLLAEPGIEFEETDD